MSPVQNITYLSGQALIKWFISLWDGRSNNAGFGDGRNGARGQGSSGMINFIRRSAVTCWHQSCPTKDRETCWSSTTNSRNTGSTALRSRTRRSYCGSPPSTRWHHAWLLQRELRIWRSGLLPINGETVSLRGPGGTTRRSTTHGDSDPPQMTTSPALQNTRKAPRRAICSGGFEKVAICL
jgi:hypothetical protein